MLVFGRDLGPRIPIAQARYTHSHQFHHLETVRGYRATKHFCIALDSGRTALKHWSVIGPHGNSNLGYPTAAHALEMADFLEQQPVSWSTLHNGTLELTQDVKDVLREKSLELGGWHN